MTPPRHVAALLAAGAVLLAACSTAEPSPSSTSTPVPAGPATPAWTPTSDPTPEPAASFPLAVVTGLTNLKASVTLDELQTSNVLLPCEVSQISVKLTGDGECVPSGEMLERLRAEPDRLALLPPGLVDPTVKVLPVDGADLFGGPEARSAEYPLWGEGIGLPEAWTAYHADEVRTLISLGDSCPDRGVAFQAITLGRGWDWVLGGGTAEYLRVYPNPTAPGTVGHGFDIVDAVPTGNEGAVAELVSGADITLDDFECPVVDNFTVNDGVVFSIDPAVLPRLRDTYGVDVVTLAANHLFDRGTAGFLETLDRFDEAGIARMGAGRDLGEALEPAVIEVNGLRFGFVGFNEIPGSLAAGPGQPGVLWLTDDNVSEAAARARAVSDVVICVPQWWGGDRYGAEYHNEFLGDMRRQQQVFFDAGCDHILGHGTHWSGPVELTDPGDGRYGYTIVSHGNFLFGQGWSQQTQEGVIAELAFVGTRLAQARLHPYIMLEQAQVNLTDPETDGSYVLNRIYDASALP